MPRYKLLTDHYLHNRLYREGETVDWGGPPSRAMQPLDKEAEQRIGAHVARHARVARLPHGSIGASGDRLPFAGALSKSDADMELERAARAAGKTT